MSVGVCQCRRFDQNRLLDCLQGSCFLIEQILSVKYSEKTCGRSSDSKEDGTDVELFLPTTVLKFWNSSLHVLLA